MVLSKIRKGDRLTHFLKLLPFQGDRLAFIITQGECPGLGASALSIIFALGKIKR